MTSPPPPDTYIVAIAREMRDGERVFVGINQPDVALAALLARRTSAPRLKFWACGSAALDPARDAERVGRSSFDPLLVADRSAFFWQARAFEEMGLRSAVCFAGGLQVDARGNANLAGVHDGERWVLRGPGSAGLPSLTAWTERFYIIVPVHEPRALVERCSRISVVGDPRRRRELGMPPNSLAAVITPLARFEPTEQGLVLTELAQGVDLDEVRARTGFAFKAASVRTRAAPTSEETTALAELRRLATVNQGKT